LAKSIRADVKKSKAKEKENKNKLKNSNNDDGFAKRRFALMKKNLVLTLNLNDKIELKISSYIFNLSSN